MCGITGVFAFNGEGKQELKNLTSSVHTLSKRGPDFSNTYLTNRVGLGHARLSIIDTSSAGNQPFSDEADRFTIVFNGEIYNYTELKKGLQEKGHQFHSESDTEVLLHLYMEHGPSCIKQLNGFFAFAIYDSQDDTLLIARDRFGIKPLLYSFNDNYLVFGSEMKACMAYGIEREIDPVSLHTYLQLNYVPAPDTMLKGVKKLLPGQQIFIQNNQTEVSQYYQLPEKVIHSTELSYEQAQQQLKTVVDKAVQKRLVSDVPLGSFLSGGIDSSITSLVASKYTNQLNTFSVGYKDEPYFDETSYAKLVANKIGSEHTVFSLSNNDLFEHFYDILDYIDEPFADSSAIAVYILSKRTKQQVTVALSGDGADELFSGYNKHSAEFRARQKNITNSLIKWGHPVWKMMPQSRSSKTGNLFRQLNRFAEGLKLSDKDRYWRWAAYLNEKQAADFVQQQADQTTYNQRKAFQLEHLKSNDFNEVLKSDFRLVLPNDMLTKVDLMSMANSLEVRTPFLDHNLVEFVFSLPSEYKIDKNYRKKILQDAFRDELPSEIYKRPKHGFEVPLLKWFQTDLKPLIEEDLLSKKLIEEQGLFNYSTIQLLKHKLYSNNPGDAHATIWALIVFQWWWKKHMQ
jgi:asparagine synthase (glutamine-hydrolysing)